MNSKEIKKYYEDKKIEEVYKFAKKYFDKIDAWADKFFCGDLLSEYDLKFAQQELNACQTKLNPIAGALEALVVEYENDYFLKEEKVLDKWRTQDKDHCKAHARHEVSDLRRYASDFTRYVYSAQSAVITVQSLLKRQTVEKGNKGVDYTGEVKPDPFDEPTASSPAWD